MELTERAIAGSWLLNGGRHGPGGFRVGQGAHVAAIWRPEPCLRAPFGLRGGEQLVEKVIAKSDWIAINFPKLNKAIQ